VADLQALGIWDTTREAILRSQGDIQNIAAIPDHMKATYKTSFQLSPYSFLEVAARAQKWIDQSISRNMYLETRDLGDMMDIYFAAWERGVKTTYYLHMKPRHTAEQSTVKVNKSEQIGGGAGGAVRKGFGSAGAAVPASTPAATAPLASAPAASAPAASAPAASAPAVGNAAPAPRRGFGGFAPKSGE
jgi:ribonucleoside-diphosphate reductase alpha chain